MIQKEAIFQIQLIKLVGFGLFISKNDHLEIALCLPFIGLGICLMKKTKCNKWFNFYNEPIDY